MRLPRKHIPLATRCRVALRQGNELLGYRYDIEKKIISEDHRSGGMGHGKLLGFLMRSIANAMMCEVSDLRLDHDPPLAARRQIKRKGKIVGYVPHEHAPDHLKYRPHGAEFSGSHLIKTNVRGDHGQHPDRVLIKRHKRRERAAAGLAQDLKRGRPLGASKGTPRKTSWPQGRKLRGRGFPKRATA